MNELNKFGQVSKINQVVFGASVGPGDLAVGLKSEQVQRHLHGKVSVISYTLSWLH